MCCDGCCSLSSADRLWQSYRVASFFFLLQSGEIWISVQICFRTRRHLLFCELTEKVMRRSRFSSRRQHRLSSSAVTWISPVLSCPCVAFRRLERHKWGAEPPSLTVGIYFPCLLVLLASDWKWCVQARSKACSCSAQECNLILPAHILRLMIKFIAYDRYSGSMIRIWHESCSNNNKWLLLGWGKMAIRKSKWKNKPCRHADFAARLRLDSSPGVF